MEGDLDIENQKVHIGYLESEMRVGYLDLSPSRWAADRGYIPTCEWTEQDTSNKWTEGVDFVMLDDEHIAFRLTGDYREDSDWQIDSPEKFVELVLEDAREWLVEWQEALEAADATLDVDVDGPNRTPPTSGPKALIMRLATADCRR
jgi:hypothetical protein